MHQLEQAVEVHPLLERALRARLDDRAVRHRIRERNAELDHVGAGAREPLQQRDRLLRVGMAGGDVRNERAPSSRLQLGETALDGIT